MAVKKALLILFFSLIFSFVSFSKTPESDSLYRHWSIISNSSKLDSLKLAILNGEPTEVIASLKKLVETQSLIEKLRESDSPPLIFPVSAGVYSGSFNSDSLSAYNQLIFLYRNLCDRRAEASALYSYGVNTALNGDMDHALTIFKESLAINTAIKNNDGIIKNYQSLARINNLRGSIPESIKLSQTLIGLSIRSRNNSSLGDAYMNLAQLWTKQGDFKSAENMVLRKALPLLYYKLNDKIGAIKCYDQLAIIYQSQKRFSEAKWFFIQSTLLARKINHSPSLVNSLIHLAHVKMAIGDFTLALNDMKEAEQLAVQNQFKLQLIEINKDLNELYTKLGDLNAANLALSQYTQLKQEILVPIL